MDEVNWSRVYAGVHFKHAVVEGAKLGAKVAEAVIARFDCECTCMHFCRWIVRLLGRAASGWMGGQAKGLGVE